MFYVIDASLNCSYVAQSYDRASDWMLSHESRTTVALYVTYYDDKEAKLLGIYPDHQPGERHD